MQVVPIGKALQKLQRKRPGSGILISLEPVMAKPSITNLLPSASQSSKRRNRGAPSMNFNRHHRAKVGDETPLSARHH